MTNKQMASFVAELVGTFILASVAFSVGGAGAVGVVIVGLTLMVLVNMMGGISGAHVNPAVTAGMLALRKIKLPDAVMYVVAQGLGALGAWLMYEYLTGRDVASIDADFSNELFVAEILGMAVFGMGIAAAVRNKLTGAQAAVTIGFSLMLGIVVASVASGAGTINPAIALGMQDLSVEKLVGPILGSVVGMSVYMWLADTAAKKS
ncbi:MAG: aquaporin [Patescibacteria group bacterium]